MSERASRRQGAGGSAFPLAGKRELGYQIEQVDAFLDRARETYDAGAAAVSPLTSTEIRGTAFVLKKGAYATRFVDAAMDRLEEVFYEREKRARMRELGEDAWWAEARQQLSEVRGRIARERGKRFRRRGIFTSGYSVSQVDAFLDRVSEMFAGAEELTTSDVRSAVFHSQWRGYDEDQVDALLDTVIELLLATR